MNDEGKCRTRSPMKPHDLEDKYVWGNVGGHWQHRRGVYQRALDSAEHVVWRITDLLSGKK